jgi:hypothetical protein
MLTMSMQLFKSVSLKRRTLVFGSAIDITVVFSSDNEYSQSPAPRAEYFAQLEEAYRAGGIVVPLSVYLEPYLPHAPVSYDDLERTMTPAKAGTSSTAPAQSIFTAW